MRTDRRTEMTKLIVTFRSFSNDPTYCLVCRYDAYFDMMYCVEQQIKSYMKKKNDIMLIILLCHMFITKIVECFQY